MTPRRRSCMKTLIAISAFVGLLTCAGRAQTVPALVNYQGRLSNLDGSEHRVSAALTHAGG